MTIGYKNSASFIKVRYSQQWHPTREANATELNREKNKYNKVIQCKSTDENIFIQEWVGPKYNMQQMGNMMICCKV